MGEIQPGAVERRRSKRAVAADQDLMQPSGRLVACADLDEAAHEVAHHVVQKAVGTEVAQKIIAAPLDVRQPQFLDG